MFTVEYLLSLKSKYNNCTVCDDLQTELQAILPPLTKTISSGDVMTDINNSLEALLSRGGNSTMPKPKVPNKKNCEIWLEWLTKYKERLVKDVNYVTMTSGCTNEEDWLVRRKNIMNKVNPKYILRNWMAQKAIEDAEKGNYSEVNKLLKRLQNPFVDDGDDQYTNLGSGKKVQISCSS